MVEIIKEMGWKYVSTVAVEGDYGERVSQSKQINLSTSGTKLLLTIWHVSMKDRRLIDFFKVYLNEAVNFNLPQFSNLTI